ncbi:MAG: hypothetical protein K5656_09680 [Lachnospiraceae bacterium]|nr:hypothetical protein [Lachnospiraceae bacterium]
MNNLQVEGINEDKEFIEKLKQEGEVEISATSSSDFSNSNLFEPVSLTEEQKLQIEGLLSHLPAIAGSVGMTGAYLVKFPKGIPHTLTKLKQGGFSSYVKGENGQFVRSASLFSMTPQAVVLGAFTVMAIASGQFFLARINNELKQISKSVEDILEFLYGEKKSDLLSEVSFVKGAIEDYSYIMNCEDQRIATLVGIQSARKTAMKDCDFYLNRIKDTADKTSNLKDKSKDWKELRNNINYIDNVAKSLEVAKELFLMSVLLEVYYSENYNKKYLEKTAKRTQIYLRTIDTEYKTVCTTVKNSVKTVSKKGVDDGDYKKYANKEKELDDNLKYDKEYNEFNKLLQLPAKENTEFYVLEDGSVYRKRIESVA